MAGADLNDSLPERRPLQKRGRGKAWLFGFDRSVPPPEKTLSGPWRPWTIPNAIAFVRLLGIPWFLVLAFGSSDGKKASVTLLFAVLSASDYLDGFVARVTGQYSRLGTLLDPLADRLLVLSGIAVCWKFALLPRPLLAVLILREVIVLIAARYGLKHGVEVKVNLAGRIAIWQILGALFFAMVGVSLLANLLLYLGVLFAAISTVAYIRYGKHVIEAAKAKP